MEEIEAAIDSLPPEFQRVAQWVRDREHALWELQLDQDSSAGKLDFLFEEAESESRDGSLRDWPAPR